MKSEADTQFLLQWQELIGQTVRHQKRKGLNQILYLVFDDVEYSLGNAFAGRNFVGEVVLDVSFRCMNENILSGSVYLIFGMQSNQRIDAYDRRIQDRVLPKNANELGIKVIPHRV